MNPQAQAARFEVTSPSPVRLVELVKAHLVVVAVDQVGPLIAAGAIRINDRVGGMSELVRRGDVVTADPSALSRVPTQRAVAPQDLALTIRHEDDDLVICEKPAGMHVHPIGPHRADTLLGGLLWHCGARIGQPWGAWRPAPAHRLDRAASGLIAIAKAASVHDAVRRLFAAGGITRRYHAMVTGEVAGDAGTIDAPLGRDPRLDYRRAIVPVERGGQHAVTHWTVIARHADRTLLGLALETGRTHQVRAHLASLGHPIVGDLLYADGGASAPVIALHAVELRLRHPRAGQELVCTSQPPLDFGRGA